MNGRERCARCGRMAGEHVVQGSLAAKLGHRVGVGDCPAFVPEGAPDLGREREALAMALARVTGSRTFQCFPIVDALEAYLRARTPTEESTER